MDENNFFVRLAHDLLNLEINTIIKADMSACKMPGTRRIAINQLARDYHKKLMSLAVRTPVYWEFAGMRSFEELRDRAKAGIAKYEEDEAKCSVTAEAERAVIRENIDMLERIQDQSSQIANMFKKRAPAEAKDKGFDLRSDERIAINWREEELKDEQKLKALKTQLAEEGTKSETWNNDVDRDRMLNIQDLNLQADEITLIRKAWDIGTERIILQTMIQVDGDVTTRMSECFATNPNEIVLRIHNQSVLTSTGFWSDLVKTLSTIAGKAFSSLVNFTKA